MKSVWNAWWEFSMEFLKRFVSDEDGQGITGMVQFLLCSILWRLFSITQGL
jgi:hypothetical protein